MRGVGDAIIMILTSRLGDGEAMAAFCGPDDRARFAAVDAIALGQSGVRVTCCLEAAAERRAHGAPVTAIMVIGLDAQHCLAQWRLLDSAYAAPAFSCRSCWPQEMMALP